MINRLGALFLIALLAATAQTDWPTANHDAAGTRYSTLKQIDTKNVDKLKLAWEFDTFVEDPPPPSTARDPGVAETSPGTPPPTPRRPRRRMSESIPLIAGGVLYMSTPYSRIVALEPETGKNRWGNEITPSPDLRGTSHCPC